MLRHGDAREVKPTAISRKGSLHDYFVTTVYIGGIEIHQQLLKCAQLELRLPRRRLTKFVYSRLTRLCLSLQIAWLCEWGESLIID